MWGSKYWPIYLIVGSVAFLIPEVYALITNAANTLSDYAWRELDVHVIASRNVHSVAWILSLISWLVFVVIITAHIWFRKLL